MNHTNESAPGVATEGAQNQSIRADVHVHCSTNDFPPATYPTLDEFAQWIGFECLGYGDAESRALALSRFGVTPEPYYYGQHAVRIEYRAETGERIGARWLVSLDPPELAWERGAPTYPKVYGLDSLNAARTAGELVITTNEADALLLSEIGIPAVAFPERPSRSDLWLFHGFPSVYVITPPGKDGEALKSAIQYSPLAKVSRLVNLQAFAGADTVRDVLARLVTDRITPDELRSAFTERMRGALDSSVPLEPAVTDGESDPSRFTIKTFTDLMATPPIEWAINGLLPVDGLGVLYGPPGVCKSFLALDMALCIATGRHFHGHTVRQGPVLFIQGESPRGLKPRVQAWLANHELDDPGLFTYVDTAPLLTSNGDTAALQAVIRDSNVHPSLIVIDTLAACYSEDENDVQAMSRFLRNARALGREYGAAVLIVHHTGKNGEVERGSSALRGAADLMLPVRSDGGVVTVGGKGTKCKDAEEPGTFYLMKTPLGPSLVLMDTERPLDDGPDGKAGEVLSYLRGCPNGARVPALVAAGFNKATAYRVLRELEAAGLVTCKLGLWESVSSLKQSHKTMRDTRADESLISLNPLGLRHETARDGDTSETVRQDLRQPPETAAWVSEVGDPFADEDLEGTP